MFKWLAKKAENVQREEAARFLESLRGADQNVVDLAMAQTMYWASFYGTKGRNLYEMEYWIDREMLFPTELVSAIRTLQREGRPAGAVGLHVWLHSSRALLHPELRLLGRNIWAELTKADIECRNVTFDVCDRAGILPLFTDPTRVPLGLERLTR